MRKIQIVASIACLSCSAMAGWFGSEPVRQSFLLDPPETCLQKNMSAYDKAKSALMYINHINHVIAKLNNMSDLMILQQEYENLTDDNLNLEAIQDETTVELIVQLMDQLKNLQEANVRSIQAQTVFEQEKKGAIWKALPQPAIFVAAKDPYTLALAIGGAALTSVQNYYNACSEAEVKKDKEKFEIGKDKLAYINEINKELFVAQWRLMRDHGIADRERVTREDSRLFLGFAEVLRGGQAGDHNRNQLVYNIFKGHEGDMRNLPFYWITRAAAAKAIENYPDLRFCCERYFELYRNAPIVRKDMDACAMALLYVSTSLQKRPAGLTNADKKQIRKWLKFIEDTVRIPEWQTKFSIAMIYRKLGDNDEARRVLEMALAEVSACIRVWEESGKKNNIFRKTPALEKAFGNERWASGDWSTWKEKAERLVPYDGFVWIAGMLYEMGVANVFDSMPCPESAFGASRACIEWRNGMAIPTLALENDHLVLRSNGIWENEDSEVCMFVNGAQCKLVKEGRGNALLKAKIHKGDSRGPVVVSARTKFGINLQFTYKMEDLLAKPEITRICPWSIK